MIQFEISTLIDRSIQEVYDFISNPLNLPRWQMMVKEISQTSQGAIGPGSTFNVISETLGRKIEGSLEITDFEPTSKFGFHMTSGPMHIQALITLKTVGSGAKVAISAKGEPGGVFKLAEGALASQVKGQMEKNLTNLKSVLESGVR